MDEEERIKDAFRHVKEVVSAVPDTEGTIPLEEYRRLQELRLKIKKTQILRSIARAHISI